ncbi:hypothetical protein [Planctobacterium marinum]|uniref:Peptidase C80 domain-containing protein n=1 Tax=Planctobacterium marinum TaxID=1631968 RepID=A0AA48I0L8_9ALTE|nr:hypothetical protein MACH26_35860 [Planctobacterium marinum]
MANKGGPANSHPIRAQTTTTAVNNSRSNGLPDVSQARSALNQQIRNFGGAKNVNPLPDVSNSRAALSKQIKAFGGAQSGKLQAPLPQQRYMVSPHDDVNNMMNNLRGFGDSAQLQNEMNQHKAMMGQKVSPGNIPMVRPVFKDEAQRSAFNKMANERLSKLGPQDKLKGAEARNNFNTYTQMASWSTQDNAMMNFSGVDKRRSHPIVYVQGHGAAGDTNIYSDANEKASANAVGRMLNKMDLPKVSQIRANSCFSGTATNLDKSGADLMQKFQDNTLDQMGGQRSETFAGALSNDLNNPSYKARYDANKAEVDKLMKRPLGAFGQLKAAIDPNNLTTARKAAIDSVDKPRHNRVVGYMGPTSQGVETVTKRTNPLDKGAQTWDMHQGVSLKGQYVLRSQAANKGPSVPGKK